GRHPTGAGTLAERPNARQRFRRPPFTANRRAQRKKPATPPPDRTGPDADACPGRAPATALRPPAIRPPDAAAPLAPSPATAGARPTAPPAPNGCPPPAA